MKIEEALKAIDGVTEETVAAILVRLAANDFTADMPAAGAFCGLSEGALKEMGFNLLLVATIIQAQEVAKRPPSDERTARELLSMRLPKEWRSPEGVTKDQLEDASEAVRARPAQVQVWEHYFGQPLDTCIIQHVATADHTNRRYSALPPNMEPVRGKGMRERHVQSELQSGPLARLNHMLYGTPGNDGCIRWQAEMSMQVCETLAQKMCQGAGSADAATAAAGAAAPAPEVGAAAGAAAAAPELGVAAVAAAAAAVPALAAGTATSTPQAPPPAPGAGAIVVPGPGLSAPGAVHAPSGRRRGSASHSAPLHSASGTSKSSRVRADFALVWTGDAQPQGPPTTPERQPVAASNSSTTAAETPVAPPPDLMTWQRAVHKYVAVGEVKRYEKLFREGRPLDLCKLWNKGSESGQTGESSESSESSELRASVRHMLDQLFTYFVVTGVLFGWFSCFYATWLAYRPLNEPDCLMLSRPFLHSDERPTAMAALSWLQAEAVKLWRDGKRHQPFPLQLRQGTDYSPGSAGPSSASPHEDPDNEEMDPTWNLSQSEGEDQGACKRRCLGAPSRAAGRRRTVPMLSADDVVLGDKIGEGSTSQVVRGLCRGKPAAIKLLLGPRGTARAEREAAMFQVLTDAQALGEIPALFGRGTLLLGTPFIATSLVGGRPLSEVGRPPRGARAAAERALAAIHAAGVAHGDVELCNMMLEELPHTSAARSTDTSMAPPVIPSGEGSDGCSGSESAAEGRSWRITFIDLGRAYTGATPHELKEEMRDLRRLLRC